MATALRNDISNFAPRMANMIHELLMARTASQDLIVESDGPTFDLRISTDQLTQAELDAVLAGAQTLVLNSDKLTITADSTDTATITYVDGSGDTFVEYEVWRAGGGVYTTRQQVDISGDGQLDIQLSTAVPDTYIIAVYRQAPNYASGFIQVEAT